MVWKMIFPEPLPDEIFSSLLARLGRINGLADYRELASLYFGDGRYASFIDAKIDLPDFCRRTSFCFDSATEVLHRLTWLGTQTRLGELDEMTFNGLAHGGLLPSLSSLTFSDSTVLSYCPSCRMSDLERFGMSYWRRIHQLPIVFFCPNHGDTLVRVRIKRYTLHVEFPVPGDFVSDLSNSEPMFGMNEKFWRGVAVMAAEALQGDELPDAEMMLSVMADELRRRKFVSPLSGVRLSALTEQLAAQAFANTFGTHSPETVTFLKRIAFSFHEPAAGMILGRIVLLYWLFGGWKAVQERCRWFGVFGSELDFSTSKAATTRSKLEAQYRRVCSAYIREHPECSRLDFLKAEYRVFRWLLHNDKVWLDRQLPIPHRGGKQLVLF
ncbi:MAG: hypothetical protein CVU32_02565 [Betaproteobacteria bacterium HGW-Betaproteobacteria-5]|jgi:hypothetical protein|nr:MAG: hypothetical protein CVU32_02565 [Betaproteobacteria bacterium HGW-Betaproteobacteria-5]PKO38573.1 MAG: hypothetical protein CVU33_08145 [Betaproteobacteria bacterium HGW-Betaproteobacteria-6]